MKRLPSVSTNSRNLSSLDKTSVENLEILRTYLVLDRLSELDSARITLDFDGSVIGTKRQAEGTAVGFNKNKKGQRSYYPLYCTVAQTGQVLGVLNRSGNVHDSNGAILIFVFFNETLGSSLEMVCLYSCAMCVETFYDVALLLPQSAELSSRPLGLCRWRHRQRSYFTILQLLTP
ncbi:MAG: hypothetical protein ACI9US_002841 [Gammaproteobacteria bacterium]